MFLITITELNKEEVECADALAKLLNKMNKLGEKRRQKVYARWSQLYLLLPEDIQRFEANVKHVNDTSGRDRKHG